jgi:nickel transport protein
MRKNYLVSYVAILSFLLSASWAHAHMFWLNVNYDTPKAGEPVQVEIGFGHKFPQDEEIKTARLGPVRAVGPDGRAVALKKLSPITYELVPKADGVYVITAQLVPGFVTRTPRGMKMQTKKGVPDANYCFRFDMAAKTLVNVGKPKSGFDRRGHSTLEIMPLKNLNSLKVGETLPVKVMFQGKPLAGAEVKFTHDGWSDPDKPFAILGKTNTRGEIQVKPDKPGRWLLIASHKTPYANPEECDENFYGASLTWRVR